MWYLKKRNFTKEIPGVSPLLNEILSRRLQTPEEAEYFLNPEYIPLPDDEDVERALMMVHEALCDGTPIIIHGDYDTDGITGAAILYDFLIKRSTNVIPHLPTRKEGYGVRRDRIETFIEHIGKDSLIIFVDCGMAARDEIKLARESGMNVIVLDHHKPGNAVPERDEGTAIISGQFMGVPEHVHTCGAGLAFLFVCKFGQQFMQMDLEDIVMDEIDLAVLGTIADVVPLKGINRWIVDEGMPVLVHGPRTGLFELIKTAEIDPFKITSTNVGFTLTPLLNASGRLEDPRISFRLLTTEDEEIAKELARTLKDINERRQTLQQDLFERVARECARRTTESIVIAGNYHQGIAGLLAGNLKEYFNAPAVVLFPSRSGYYSGSARSVKGFDIALALDTCRKAGLLTKCGGHSMAAGLAIPEKNIPRFAEMFEELYLKAKKEEILVYPRDYFVDAELEISGIYKRTIEELERLQPCGTDNPEATLIFRNCQGLYAKEVGQGHLSILIKDGDGGRGYYGIGFNKWEEFSERFGHDGEDTGRVSGAMDVLGRPFIDTYNGEERIKIRILDIKPSSKENLKEIEMRKNHGGNATSSTKTEDENQTDTPALYEQTTLF